MKWLAILTTLISGGTSLDGQWVIENGNWESKQGNIEMTMYDSLDSTQYLIELYQFNSDGSFVMKRKARAGVGFCGTGMLIITEGTWKLKSDTLIVSAKAKRLGMEEVKFVKTYKVHRHEGQLNLEWISTDYFKVLRPFIEPPIDMH